VRRSIAAVALAAVAGVAAAVEVNTASRAQLEALPGLGVATTDSVLAERARAPFADWADLLRRVKGLKRAAATLSAAGLTVAGEPYAPAASAPR
jgi:competence protein ComEA